MLVKKSVAKQASTTWSLREYLLRVAKDRRGVAILEFAIVGPAFIFFVFAMIDAMWMLTIELAMNEGVHEAGRLGSLGNTPSSGTREAAIKNLLVQRGAGMLDATKLTVTMTTFGSGNPRDYATRTGTTTTATGAGLTRQLVQYQVAYVQPLITPIGIAYNGGTTVTHTATIVVQNEPF